MQVLDDEAERNKILRRLGKTHKFRKVEPKNFEVSGKFRRSHMMVIEWATPTDGDRMGNTNRW